MSSRISKVQNFIQRGNSGKQSSIDSEHHQQHSSGEYNIKTPRSFDRTNPLSLFEERQKIAEMSKVKTPRIKLEHSQSDSARNSSKGNIRGAHSIRPVKKEESQATVQHASVFDTDVESINDSTTTFDVQVKHSQSQDLALDSARRNVPNQMRSSGVLSEATREPRSHHGSPGEINVVEDGEPSVYRPNQPRVLRGLRKGENPFRKDYGSDEAEESEGAVSEEMSPEPDQTMNISTLNGYPSENASYHESSPAFEPDGDIEGTKWKYEQDYPDQTTSMWPRPASAAAIPYSSTPPGESSPSENVHIQHRSHGQLHSHDLMTDIIREKELLGDHSNTMRVNGLKEHDVNHTRIQHRGHRVRDGQGQIFASGKATSPAGNALQRQIGDAHIEPLHREHVEQDQPYEQHIDGKRGVKQVHPPQDLASAANLDYSEEELRKMKYEQLKSEDFDHNPGAPPNVLPEDIKSQDLDKQLIYISNFKHLPEDEQSEFHRAFFESLSIDQYEECGDLMVDRLAQLVKKLKDGRRTRRKIAIEFEAEVAAREEDVRAQGEEIDRDMVRFKKAGQDMIGGRGA